MSQFRLSWRRPVMLAAVACGALALPAVAGANPLPPSALTSPITVPAMGNWADGESSLSVTFTDKNATATATGKSIGLAAGYLFRIENCLQEHVGSATYTLSCQSMSENMLSAAGTAYAPAPTTKATIARLTNNTPVSFSYEVSVWQQQADGSYTKTATSLPKLGLAAGSLAVPRQGATTAPGFTGAAPKLAWAPPALNNPITVNVTDTNHQLVLDNSRDYVVQLPSQPLSVAYGLSIAGGHNVVIKGGEIDIPWLGSAIPPAGSRTALYLKDQTGTVHVEGVLFRGADLADGIDVDERLGGTLQLENVRSEDNHARDEVTMSDVHPDCLQTWGGPAVLRVDRLTCTTEGQGFFLHPQQYDSQAVNNLTDLRNVNITAANNYTGYLLWQADPFPKRLENVSVVPNPIKPWDTFWPDPSYWPSVSTVAPATGDNVPAGSVGIGYVSPGYAQG
jgi:hypothetical protein